MMATLEELTIKLGVDDSDMSKLDGVKSEFEGLGDSFSKAEGYADSFFSGLSSGASAVIGAVGNIASALGLDDIPGKAMEAAQSISSTEASLTGVYGSADRAAEMMAKTNEEFAGTRVGAMAVNDLAINLGYMGLEADATDDIIRNVVDSVEFLGGTDENIDSISSALIDAQNSGTVFNDTLNQLSANGVPIFDLLTEKLGITEQELKSMASNGELDIDTLLSALAEFDSEYAGIIQEGIGEVRDTWDYQWDAMKNGTAYAIGDMLNSMMKTDEAQAIMSGLTDIIVGIPDAIQTIGNKLVELGLVDMFMSIYDAVASLGEGAMPIVMGAFDGFVTVISEVAGYIMDVAQGFSGFGEALDKIPEPILDLLGKFLGAFAGVALTVAAGIKAIAIAQALWNAIMLVSPLTWIILGIIALIAVIVLVIAYWDEIAEATAAAWDWIKEILSGAWDWIVDLFTNAWEWLVDLVTGIWDSLLQLFLDGTEWLIEAVRSGLDWIMELFMSWHPLGIIISHWDSIVQAFQDGKQKAIDLVMGLVENVMNLLRRLGELPGMVGEFFRGMYDRARTQAEALLSFVRGIPGKVKGFFSNAKGFLLNAGKNIIQGLIDGVSNMIGRLRDKFTSVTNMIPDWKGPERVDLKLLEGPGEDIMEGLINGIDHGANDLRSTLGGITSDIPGMVGISTSAQYSGAAKVVIDVTGADDDFKRMFRKMVRVDGGGSAENTFGQ